MRQAIVRGLRFGHSSHLSLSLSLCVCVCVCVCVCEGVQKEEDMLGPLQESPTCKQEPITASKVQDIARLFYVTRSPVAHSLLSQTAIMDSVTLKTATATTMIT